MAFYEANTVHVRAFFNDGRMESVGNVLTIAQVVEEACLVSVPLPQTTCFYVGDSKMTKMTVRCGGSAESADIFRSFSFCNAWRRLAEFCSKKLTDLRSDREQLFNFANLTNQWRN